MTMPKTISPELWRKYVRPGDRVFIGSNAACPNALVRNFLEQAESFRDVEIVHILTLGGAPWTDAKYSQSFRMNALFLGPQSRDAVRRGDADYTPCFLSEVPSLFIDGILPIDLAMIQVSPPDQHGYCSLGVSVDVVHAASRSARRVVAQINPSMPRTFGNSFIHISRLDAILEADEPLPELAPATLDDVTLRIGHHVSLLIEDGSTLQMGIGKIPDAVLNYLHDRNDLGIHTEMFSDGVVDLIREGVVNNRRKNTHLGKSVVSFCMGTKKLYDFVHENPHVEFHPSEYVNNPANISRNDRQVSINSAIEVDLSGQVVADSVGYRFYSGIGGQVDFIRGAAMSRGGRPIIALPATAQGGKASRIVPFLTEGAGVVTSRGDVHYVVTEFGIATLRGKSIRERALELIQVAHPDFRDELLDKIRQRYWVPGYQPPMPPPIADLADVEQVKLEYRNNQYFLRPLRPTDERLVRLFFYTYNTSALPTLEGDSSDHPRTQKRAHTMVHMDMSTNLALAIVERQGPREVIHAIGRYEINESGKSAELRVWVREDKRGMGMATTLVKQMVRLAKGRQVKRLDARVQAENGAMLHLLEQLSFTRRKVEDRQIEVSLELRKG